jgi:hypothetical protein
VKKSIVIDFNNNLICKNCGFYTAVNWQNFNQQTGNFMATHENCQHGDDLLTLDTIADRLGISRLDFRNYTTKINLPEPLPFIKGKGTRKFYSAESIDKWSTENDIRKLIGELRGETYRKNNTDAKPYVAKEIKEKPKVEVVEKPLPLINRFIRSGFILNDTERQAKIQQARANKPKRVVLACFEDKDGDFVREFV